MTDLGLQLYDEQLCTRCIEIQHKG